MFSYAALWGAKRILTFNPSLHSKLMHLGFADTKKKKVAQGPRQIFDDAAFLVTKQ